MTQELCTIMITDHPARRRRARSLTVGLALGAWLACTPGGAWAAVTVPAAPSPPPAPASPSATPGSTAPGAPGAHDEQGPDSRAMGEIARRRAALDKRERALELREARIAAAETMARREIAALTELRGQVTKMITRETSKADADLTLLATLYSNMKPAQAGAIMSKLDIPKAAAILRRLDTRMAGPVLASIDPDIAANISKELEKQGAAFR